jgi:hypothetical protein
VAVAVGLDHREDLPLRAHERRTARRFDAAASRSISSVVGRAGDMPAWRSGGRAPVALGHVELEESARR